VPAVPTEVAELLPAGRRNAAANRSVPPAVASENANRGIEGCRRGPPSTALAPPKMFGMDGDASRRTPHAATAETATRVAAVVPCADLLALCTPAPPDVATAR
jgi:hypothetical protein